MSNRRRSSNVTRRPSTRATANAGKKAKPLTGQSQLFPESLQDQRQLAFESTLGKEADRKKAAEEAREKRRQSMLFASNPARFVRVTLSRAETARWRAGGRPRVDLLAKVRGIVRREKLPALVTDHEGRVLSRMRAGKR